MCADTLCESGGMGIAGVKRARLEGRAERCFAMVSEEKGVLSFDARGGSWEMGTSFLGAGRSRQPPAAPACAARRLPGAVAVCQVAPFRAEAS